MSGPSVTPSFWVQSALSQPHGIFWGAFYRHRTLLLSPWLFCFKTWMPWDCVQTARYYSVPPRPSRKSYLQPWPGPEGSRAIWVP